MPIGAVKIFTEAIESLSESEEIPPELVKAAESIASRVRAPRHLTVYTRKGVSSRGAFAQVVMRGRGAVAIEYGTARMRASAPLRNALGGGN